MRLSSLDLEKMYLFTRELQAPLIKPACEDKFLTKCISREASGSLRVVQRASSEISASGFVEGAVYDLDNPRETSRQLQRYIDATKRALADISCVSTAGLLYHQNELAKPGHVVLAYPF